MNEHCPNCQKLAAEIAGLRLSLKRVREQYDRVYNQAVLAAKYKRQRDSALRDHQDLLMRIAEARKRRASKGQEG